MLGPVSRRPTRYVRCAHCTQTRAPSQMTKRAARADPGPALLAATHSARAEHRLPRIPPIARSDEPPPRPRKGAPGQAAQRLGGAEKRRARGRARSALRHLTRRRCLNAANAVSVLRQFQNWNDHRSEAELNFKFHRQATNKIGGISSETTRFLDKYF